MEQNLINFTLFVIAGFGGWFGKTVWDSIRATNTGMAEFREEVAKDYVRKDDFNRVADRLFEKLDLIHDKLDRKMDK